MGRRIAPCGATKSSKGRAFSTRDQVFQHMRNCKHVKCQARFREEMAWRMKESKHGHRLEPAQGDSTI